MNVGIIGYGVRVDMLIDAFMVFDPNFKIQAITDTNIPKVKALLNQDSVSKEQLYEYGLDKVDAHLRQTPICADDIHFYEDADAMLDNEKLDGVIVGTNCDTHTFFAKKVLARNLPLFLEKPVATTMEDVKALMEAGSNSDSQVVVSFPLRLTPVVQEVKRLVQSGIIGKVEHVQAWNDVSYGYVYFHDWYRDESKTHGLFLQKATHDLDVINYLVGEKPVKICAMKSKQIYKGDMPANLRCSICDKKEICQESYYFTKIYRNDDLRNDYCCFAVDTGNEDSGSAIVRYESGMHASYSQNFFVRKGAARRGARLHGYLGTIEYEFVTNTIRVFDHLSNKVQTIVIDPPRAYHGGGDGALAENFIRIMQGKEISKSPLSAGIESVLTCICATKSAEAEQFVEIKFE